MVCSDCNSTETAREGNKIWCTSCGNELQDAPMWTHSYAMPNHYKRFPVYSRVKRFIEYIRKLNEPELNNNYNDLLDLFSLIEFQWGMRLHEKRKYFYNKYVVLFFIAKKLSLPVKLRTLKDEERVEEQLEELEKLLNHGFEMFH